MKYIKQLFIILLLVFLLVGLGTISASDVTKNDTSVTKSIDVTKTNTPSKDISNRSNVLSTQKTKDNNKIVDKKPYLKTNKTNQTQKQIEKKIKSTTKTAAGAAIVNNYDELVEKVEVAKNSAADEYYIYLLPGDYTATKEIMWENAQKTTLTISGNNIVLNGNNSNLRFLTIAENHNVILDNITIKNYTFTDSRNYSFIHAGGAIDNNGNLTIKNANIKNNYVNITITPREAISPYIIYSNIYGGAIHNNGTLSIINTSLTENEVQVNYQDGVDRQRYYCEGYGGAIYTKKDSKTEIINSSLTNNFASYSGGAIHNRGTLNITDSNLDYNNASWGGAVDNDNGTITITNTNLTQNNAHYGGSIVEIYGILNITNSNLTHNNAEDGGTIYIMDGSLNIIESNLIYNNANSDGGAISINDGTLNITNSNLSYNTAKRNGGAMYIKGSTIILDSILNNNKAAYGGAFYAKINETERISVISSTLNNNTATSNGGSILQKEGSLLIKNSNLTHATALQGGAIYNINGNVTIIESNLKNNNAEWYGGAIYNNATLSIRNSNLTFNNAGYEGGAIYNNNGNTTITDAMLNNNSLLLESSLRGVAIKNRGNLNLSKSTLSNNTITGDSVSCFVIDFIRAKSVIITDNYFDNNTNNIRDMLFSDAEEDVIVEIHDNTYTDNLLACNIITPVTSVVLDNKEKSYNYDVDLELRNIYNDTIRNGTVNVYVNGISKESSDVTNGETSISFNNTDLTLRENIVTLEYITYSKHYQNKTVQFSIFKEVNTTLSIEAPQSMISGDTVEINFTLKDKDGNPIEAENVQIYVDTVNVANLTTNEGGVTAYKFTPLNNATVTISGRYHSNPNSMYNSAEDVEAEIIVNKIQPALEITNITQLVAHQEIGLQFNLTDNGRAIAGKVLNINISEEGKSDITGTATTNNDGIAIFNFIPDDDGIFQVNSTFAGDVRYFDVTEVVELYKDKVRTSLEITATNTTVNTTNIITLKVTASNKALINGTVTLNISGEICTVNIREGNGTYTSYKPLTVGEKNITGNFTSTIQGYENSYAEEKFTVEKIPTRASITLLNNTVGNVTIKATIKAEDNIQSTVNGGIIEIKSVTTGTEKTIYTETLKNGEVTYKTDIQETGEYEFKVIYNGSDYFTKSENNTKTIQIIPINTKTITYNKTANVGSTITLNATIKDETGVNINEGEVKFYLNKTQIAQTNTINNGIATTQYTLPTSITPGTYQITAQYTGNKKYNTSSNNATLTINTLNTQITSQTLDNTKDNTTIKVRLTSPTENNKAIVNAPITITDKNGKAIGQSNTNNNGEATIKLDLPIGNNPLKITYPGNSTYKTTSTNTNINVAKIPTTTTINIQNNTAGNVTVNGAIKDKYNKAVTTGIVNIKNGNTIIGTGQVTNGAYNILTNIGNKGTYTLTAEYTGTSNYLASSTKTTTPVTIMGKTPVLTSEITGNTVGKTNVIATLKNPDGTPIIGATIVVTQPDTTTKTGITNNNGVANIPVDLKEGTESVKVSYAGNGTYNQATTTTPPVKVNKNTPVIKLNTVKGVIGEDITLTAYLNDVDGTPINGGNLAFKLNGKTLRNDGRFDSNAPAMKFKVENGKVIYKIKADLYLRNAKNLTASYSGNYKYQEINSPSVEAQIQKRYANITVTVTPKVTRQYNNITIKITAKDTTKNGKNQTLVTDNTKAMLKINGVTLKDSKGNTLYITIQKDKTATYTYYIPPDMGGVTSTGKTRNYPVTAIFVGNNYYPGAKNVTTFQVERSNTTVTIQEAKVVTKTNVLSVKATLTDYKGNNLKGTNKVTIKINGKNYVDPKNGKAKYWSVKDGVVNLTGIQVDSKTTIKRVMLVTGERQAYTEGRAETTNIIRT